MTGLDKIKIGDKLYIPNKAGNLTYRLVYVGDGMVDAEQLLQAGVTYYKCGLIEEDTWKVVNQGIRLTQPQVDKWLDDKGL